MRLILITSLLLLSTLSLAEDRADTLSLAACQYNVYSGTFSSSTPTFFPADGGAEVYVVYWDGIHKITTKVVNCNGGAYVPSNTGVLVRSRRNKVAYLHVDRKNIQLPPNSLRPSSLPMKGRFVFLKWAYNNYSKKSGLGWYYGADDGKPFKAKPGGAYLAVPVNNK